MIFYFSGTGNSLQVAKSIGEYNEEKLISIAREMDSMKSEFMYALKDGGGIGETVEDAQDTKFRYTLKDGETIGFVYPVYAWAPPRMVLNFIEKLSFDNYKDNYVFSVATCGENIGNTMKVLGNSLRKRNLNLNSGFSVVMPNNYIIMGDVDSKDTEEKKLLLAEETLKNINLIIEERKSNVFQVVKGFMPGVLSGIINPLFNKSTNDTKKFYVDDRCIGCGICERVCNSNTIKVEGKPKWGRECTQCLACIHLCPVKAIQYGKGTEKKGRYKNPNVSIEEMEVKR